MSKDIVIYLSTAPKFFVQICENLAAAGLNADNVRVVSEKSLGTDLQSSREISDNVVCFYGEDQIYRIDHYSGKESLQSLLVLRFANVVLESLWSHKYIKNVQLTVAEQLGMEECGEFYDTTSALRNMVQSRLLQMLCTMAMEFPTDLDTDAVYSEKVKVLKASKPMTSAGIDKNVVRGQYTIAGGMNSCLQEVNVPSDGTTEICVTIRIEIGTPHWAGAPFYLRIGKCMVDKVAEVVLNSRELDNRIFENSISVLNRLVIRLQPGEVVRLYMQVKTSGMGNIAEIAPSSMDLDKAAEGHRVGACKRPLSDVINGKPILSNRRDELEAAWEYVMPIPENQTSSATLPHGYTVHSRGPEVTHELLAHNGDKWHEEQ